MPRGSTTASTGAIRDAPRAVSPRRSTCPDVAWGCSRRGRGPQQRARGRHDELRNREYARAQNRRLLAAAEEGQLLTWLDGPQATRDCWDDVNICTALYCSAMPPKHGSEPQTLAPHQLGWLAAAMERFIERKPGFAGTMQAVANGLYGLQEQGDSAECRAVLRSLARLAARSQQCPTPPAVGIALYGLRQQHVTPESTEVLAALSPAITRCAGPLHPQALSMALYGLQGMYGSPAADGVLAALLPFVASMRPQMKAVHVGNALYGLPHDSPPARELLPPLAEQISRCADAPDNQQASSALYGLCRMGAAPETEVVLAALAPLIARCAEPFPSRAVGIAFYGLRQQRDCPAVRGLLLVLTRLSESCPEPLGEFTGMAIQGLKGLGTSREAQAARIALAHLIARSEGEQRDGADSAERVLMRLAAPGKPSDSRRAWRDDPVLGEEQRVTAPWRGTMGGP
eukprot:TRINITY_DN40513_c0_g1_i1.p2 TRINITY_DN40513_c0_g1~~TRINITY_DN40513_c0_g1_i1.p2  ORF type:complete len:458 (+),score=61.23 TRINITY_DN40513_c0_g1_i1:67-1440(+)